MGDDPGGGRFDEGSLYDETVTVVGALGEYLKENFLTGGNYIDWKGVSGGLIGGLLLAVWQGLIGLPLAFAEAIDELTSPVADAFSSGADGVFAQIQTNADLIWDAAQFGAFSVVVNVAVALAAGAIIAWGVS